ncbi:flavin reductase family protein [Pseudoduganella ginsengisoli]|uniref:Flavin reductase family protein n=1 Tax=Pseudoduganella ginsengisoli TaxID=1462440 RepID=A0A6L6Q2W9_9BURK|nr:flavin reductase family protein [Pseudoduganella ginsengisoli]MTW03754.1 flavin reductase family protein [Pseudoduganella ginsengisoli]
MEYHTATLDANTVYRVMVNSILPRPIAWISTVSADGVANLAPYSFFTVASCNPPVLSVTQVNPRDRPAKDTLTNLRATGACVVNIVSAALAEQMNATCADYPSGISEFDAVGITRAPGQAVAADGVAESPVRFECRLREVIEISPEPSGGTMMLLDVVHIHVADSVLANGVIDPQLLDAVGKMGGNGYANTRERFDLARPVYKAAP